MTITNDPTTAAPEVPAWLNLDGYCPPEVRYLLRTSAERVETLVVETDALFRDAWLAMRAHDDATSVFVDETPETLNVLCGYRRLHTALMQLTSLIEAASGDNVDAEYAPEWYVPWGTELTITEEVGQ